MAKKRAKVCGAKIDVVKCMAQNRELNYEDIQMVEHKLEREVHDHLNSGYIPYETHLVISGRQFGEDLVLFAEDNQIDEIVVGVRRRSKVGKLLMGSTAQHVILNAPCPVATIK
ncbi:universal stress protein [Thermodesulfobacteriota bacterium]